MDYKIIAGGVSYISENDLREALGIGEESDIFEAIAFLKKSNERSHSEMYKARGEKYELEKKIREALGTVDEYVDLIGIVRKLKAERDELKEKCDKLKARTNALYGTSCGYSASKQPAFRCNVISYSWEFGTMLDTGSIRVELDLIPNANYKGTFDMEDLRRYIEAYGREKKLSDFETFCKLVDNCIDELCDKYNVVQPERIKTTRERLDYIFDVLADYRELANINFRKAEDFRKGKQALSDSLAELRAKVREIYRSVFCDCRWEDGYSYCSALNDIKEEYERVKYFFKEKSDELKETKEKYSRYCLAVGSLCNIPAEHREDISWIEDAFNHTKKDYLKWQTTADRLARLRSDICTALCLGGETSDEDILKAVAEARKKCNDLTVFRNDVAKAIGLPYIDINSDIINRVMEIRECHEKLYKDYAKLHEDFLASQKQVKGFTNRCDSLENLRRDLWEFRKNAIEDLKSRGFFFRPEENETLPEIYSKLLKRYDDYFGRYKEQYRLRQCWHVRWESENERANGVQKKLDKLRGIEAERDKYKENCKYWSDMYSSSEAACGALKGKIRELKDEKTKVISAIGQDIWDDCLK